MTHPAMIKNQLDAMRVATAALMDTPTGGDLAEHYDDDTGKYRARDFGFVENLIAGVIDSNFEDHASEEDPVGSALANAVKWLRDMASEIQAVAGALEQAEVQEGPA